METLKDLVEEAKRRTILVAILVLIVAYIMSLTSSSVWINLPVSIVVLAAIRRLSFEVEFRWKPRTTEGRPQYPLHQNRRQLTNYDPLLSGLPCQVAVTRWRRIIDSPVVEEAVDELTRSVIGEFVTGLWYSSITPDQEAPEELRILLNGVIAEVAYRAKRVNLMTLLSKDVVDLVGSHFELFRQMKAKIGPDIIGSMSIDERDEKLKHAMMTSRKLHPALISPEAEYKVLKKLTGGVVALVLKRQDSHCRLLRTLARELLACAVLRPVLNFASPGYINELIESLATASSEKERQRDERTEELAPLRIPDPMPQKKSSSPGVEMTSLGPLESKKVAPDINSLQKSNETYSKTIGGVGTSTRSQPSRHTKSMKKVKSTKQAVPDTEVGEIPTSDWAQDLKAHTQRRAQALAPEHLDNVWAKGRNYKRRESEKSTTLTSPSPVTKTLVNNLVSPKAVVVDMSPEVISGQEGELTSGELPKESTTTIPIEADDVHLHAPLQPNKDRSAISEEYEALFFGSSKDGEEHLPGIGFSPLGTPRPNLPSPEDSTSTLQARNIGGPVLSRTASNENLLGSSAKTQSTTETYGQSPSRFRYHHRSGASSQRLRRAVRLLAHRKSKSSGGTSDGWNLDVGSSSQGLTSMLNAGEISPVTSPASESRWRSIRKSRSPHVSLAPVQVDVTEVTEHTSSTMLDCRVMGAHFERIGSRPFAVFTIRVQDTEERTWRIQRRFRNFEQLHRRLKDMPYYNLSLPPKRFLSSSLDNNFVRERCILLDKYLKDLLAIPSVAELHEVWDFLSVNSQHYTNGNSVSMMRTLAVNVDDAVDDMFRQIRGVSDDISGALKSATTGIRHRFPSSGGYSSDGAAFSSAEDHSAFSSRGFAPRFPSPLTTPYSPFTDSELSERLAGASVSEDEYGGTFGGNVHGLGSHEWQSDSDVHLYPSDTEPLKIGRQPFASGLDLAQSRLFASRMEGAFSNGHSPVESYASETVADVMAIPHEWTPPKVSVPLLNLVDLIFQLQGRGWIRRQVLWMAKQILQLGMGDAIDDWLLGRIQWLRREEVVASGIHWVKDMLWPDGIFVTKHPRNLPEASAAILESTGFAFSEEDQAREQRRPPLNSFEYRVEAARRARVVREIILEKAPTAVVNLIGRKQYARCAKDIYYFSQSTVCVKQLTYSLLEMLLANAFPELHDLILDVRSSVT